jgi:hypothetical protein
MIARQWSARAEYLHYGFAGSSASAAFTNTGALPGTLTLAIGRQDIDTVRVGLNYHL